MYRVFLGAPAASELDSNATYHWQTFSSTSLASRKPTGLTSGTGSFVLPAATLEAASRRISLIYRNAIFDQSVEDEDQSLEESSFDLDDGLHVGSNTTMTLNYKQANSRWPDGSTVITWPPTEPQDMSTSVPSLQSTSNITGDVTTNAFLDSTRYETQIASQSFNYSDASSIARFPTFHFNVNALGSLGFVDTKSGIRGSVKVNLLLAVLEIEGPDTITIKKGSDAGKEVGILRMILGDEVGNVCKLTAWRETAEEWGGLHDELGTKRGDVIHLENVLIACEPGLSATLTGSPNLKSKMTICFRTLPYSHEDGRLRPDLRLGDSDPCVRKVSTVVRWFQGMAGIPVSS